MRTVTVHRLAASVFFSTAVLASFGADDYPLQDAVECSVRGGLPNVFGKLAAGKPVKIGYLGGSITSQPGWRPKTLAWFREQFPNAQVDEINAAIGGTGSNLGVFRLQHDVLRHAPDLLFVEFATNDGGASPITIHRAMEGIVRQTWQHDASTDICYVYTLAHETNLELLQNGKFSRAASAMEEVADHYSIPTIHMGLEVARLAKEGTLLFRAAKGKTEEEKKAQEGKILFSGDGVHPYTDGGHVLYLEAVARSMAKIKAVGKPAPHVPGKPLREDNWEKAKLVPLSKAIRSNGWTQLDQTKDSLAKRFANRLPEMWTCDTPGEWLSFRFKGTQAGFYDLLGPDCGQLTVMLDEQKPRVVRRIDGYCSYHRLASLTVGSDLDDTVHTVRVEIHPNQPDKAKILHSHRLPELEKNPAKYDGIAWYVGAIMLIGDLVEQSAEEQAQ